MSAKACIGCESPMGEPHQDWCPVVTGTLSTLPGDGHDQRAAEAYAANSRAEWLRGKQGGSRK